MKKLVTYFATAAITLTAMAAQAQPELDNMSHEERREKIKAMSPEERQEFFQHRKAQWQQMDKQEKLKLIEERRAKRLQHMDEKWKSMSDDEKISHVEEKMKRKKERWKEHREKEQNQ